MPPGLLQARREGYHGAVDGWRPASERNRERRDRLMAEARRCATVLASAGATRVILFGSLATGRGPVDDIDLIAVMPTDLPFVERSASLFDAIDSAESIDLLVYTPAEFEAMASSSALVMNALSTGVTLHEKRTGA